MNIRKPASREITAKKPKPYVVLQDIVKRLFGKSLGERKLPTDLTKLRKLIKVYLDKAFFSRNANVILQKKYKKTMEDVQKKYPSVNVYWIVNPYLKKIEMEQKQFIEKLDKLTIDQLIAKYPDRKQREQWKKIKDLKWPRPKGKAKLVILAGGLGLNTHLDVAKMKKSLKKVYGDKLEVIEIKYTEGTDAQKALKKFEKHVRSSSSKDLIIPYITGHGTSRKRDNLFVFEENSKRKALVNKYGLTSDHFRKVVSNNKNKKFLFTIDTCFSGSALDDPIANEPNIVGMIAAVSKTQVSGGGPKGGKFTNLFTRYIDKGKELGEAFIRADAASRGKSTKSSNPTAFFRMAGRKLVVN